MNISVTSVLDLLKWENLANSAHSGSGVTLRKLTLQDSKVTAEASSEMKSYAILQTRR